MLTLSGTNTYTGSTAISKGPRQQYRRQCG